jgi:hypothetical protein
VNSRSSFFWFASARCWFRSASEGVQFCFSGSRCFRGPAWTFFFMAASVWWGRPHFIADGSVCPGGAVRQRVARLARGILARLLPGVCFGGALCAPPPAERGFGPGVAGPLGFERERLLSRSLSWSWRRFCRRSWFAPGFGRVCRGGRRIFSSPGGFARWSFLVALAFVSVPVFCIFLSYLFFS